MQKIATAFSVHGQRVQGFFHKPEQATESVPLIVMFNGYATEWQFGTVAFIRAFTNHGYATLNFDYRSFGGSEGEPRQVLDIPAQLEDCAAAIAHGLLQPWVDNKRVFVWGSSLGGGHAISMAAEFPQLAGMLAQVPHCDSRAAFKTVTLKSVFTGMSQAILDVLGSKIGKPARRIPVLAEPSEYAVMNHPGWYKHYMSLAAGSPTWENQIAARSLLRGADYRPILSAENIRCKSLLVAGRQDAGVPIESVQETASLIVDVELFIYEGDHFEVYGGDQQPMIIEKQLQFIEQLLNESKR